RMPRLALAREAPVRHRRAVQVGDVALGQVLGVDLTEVLLYERRDLVALIGRHFRAHELDNFIQAFRSAADFGRCLRQHAVLLWQVVSGCTAWRRGGQSNKARSTSAVRPEVSKGLPRTARWLRYLSQNVPASSPATACPPSTRRAWSQLAKPTSIATRLRQSRNRHSRGGAVARPLAAWARATRDKSPS